MKLKLDAANAAFRIFLEKELAAEFGKSVKKEIELDRALQAKLQQWLMQLRFTPLRAKTVTASF